MLRRMLMPLGVLMIALGVTRAAPPPNQDVTSADVVAGRFPRDPGASARAVRVPPGFAVELFAADPDLASPVGMTFDADGDVYVAEMLDYPIIRTAGMFGPFPEGQVRLLRTDEHGKVVKSTVFAAAIAAPTSVAPYDGGVLVAAAPDILFLKDTDGDGHADVRQVVLTGFDTSQDLYRVNSLQWGIDGWIYARGVGETPIHWGDDPNGPALATEGMDFRFRPKEKRFEAVSGRSGCFGLTMDDWGHRFFSNSANHVFQVVMPIKYLRRNPLLASPSLVHEISDHGGVARVFRISPPQLWRVERSEFWDKSGLNEKYFGQIEGRQDFMTATCGPKVYRESAFPPEYRGNYFVCEAVGNLVHRDVLKGPGPVYTASRGDQEREFLASADNWCGPVAIETGPDGSLYIVDMYRQVIEHAGADGGRDVPNVPVEVLQRYGLRAGSTMGRIYRVKSEKGREFAKPRLARAEPTELVRDLDSPDAWWRTTAQRLILERPEAADVDAIATVARSSPHPAARVQALKTLETLGRLDSKTVAAALGDRVPGVRENALQAAESLLAADPSLASEIIKLAEDPDPTVRFQSALTLGEVHDPGRLPALASLARRDGDNPDVRTAILSSIGDDRLALLRSVADGPAPVPRDLARLIGAGLDAGEIGDLLVEVDRLASDRPHETTAAVLKGLAGGIQRRGRREIDVGSGQEALRRLLKNDSEPVREAAGEVASVARLLNDAERAEARARAAATALDDDKPIAERVKAARALGAGEYEAVAPTLNQLLQARNPEPLQIAALDALDALAGPGVVSTLAEAWRGLTPNLRPRALDVAMGRTERLVPLLEAVRRGEVPAGTLDPGRRARLLGSRDAAVADLAKAVLGEPARAADARRFEALRGALERAGDSRRGLDVFKAKCLTCHLAGREGTEIGPNLASVKDRPRDQILRDILEPSLSVQPQYVQCVVETTNGQILSGLLLSSDATSLTLRRPGVEDVTLLRKDIEALASTGVSVMPEGLLDGLKPQEVADLLEYVKQVR